MDIEVLKSFGNEWEKDGHHRIYFSDLAGWIGLEVNFHSPGNFDYASLGGESISKLEALDLLKCLRVGRLWFDIKKEKFFYRFNKCHGLSGSKIANLIIEAIEKEVCNDI
jgi:hypothetical protein